MLEKLSLKDSLWRAMAIRITNDKTEADELVQCMYLRILDYNVSQDKITDVFVSVVLSNLFKDSKRKSKYNDTFCYSFNEGSKDSSEDISNLINYFHKLTNTQPQSEYNDNDIDILNSINLLPNKDKNLLELNYSYSIRKVAEIQGMTYITVYRELIRIRKCVLGDRFEKEYKNRRLKYKNNGRNVA